MENDSYYNFRKKLLSDLDSDDNQVVINSLKEIGLRGFKRGTTQRLVWLLRRNSSMVLSAAAEACGRLRVRPAVPDLLRILNERTEEDVLRAANHAIRLLGVQSDAIDLSKTAVDLPSDSQTDGRNQ